MIDTSGNAIKTTTDKIRELFVPRVQERIGKEGLEVVDRADFDTMTRQNNELSNENKTLRLRVRELEAQLGRQTRLI